MNSVERFGEIEDIHEALTDLGSLSLAASSAGSVDRASTESHNKFYDGYRNNINSNSVQSPLDCETFLESFNSTSVRGDDSSNDVLYVGSNITVKDENKCKPKKNCDKMASDKKLEGAKEQVADFKASAGDVKLEKVASKAGWILSLAKGKGTKVSLKSMVKGKPVYNKIIDLDAESDTRSEGTSSYNRTRNIGYTNSFVLPSSKAAGSSSSDGSRKRHAGGKRHTHTENRHFKDVDCNYLSKISSCTSHGFEPYGNEIGSGGIYQYYPGFTERRANGAPTKTKFHLSPDMFNRWIRVLFNVAVTFLLLYLGFVFLVAISRDIGNGLEKQRQKMKGEALVCQENYLKNQCRTVKVPAMEEQCREWESCMYKDAVLYEETSFLSAEVLGGVINKFVSQLDIRTVGIVIAAFLALFVGSNCALTVGADRSSSGGNKRRWFSGSFGKRSLPHNGSELFLNPQMLHSAQFIHNPYIVPNYCHVGGYPYVNLNYHPNATRFEQENTFYSNRGTRGCGHALSDPKQSKNTNSAWKRRFISAWEDT